MAHERSASERHESERPNQTATRPGPRSPFIQVLQILGSVGVIVYLGHRLSIIGWTEVLRSLPRVSWFYLLFAGQYLAIPIAEFFIYRHIWNRPRGREFPVLLRKRVLNFGVVGYLGEAYFGLWAQQTLGKTVHQAFSVVKDVDVLSALVSNVTTVLLVIAFLLTGELQAFVTSTPNFFNYFAIFAGVVAMAIVAVVVLRRRIFLLETRTLAFMGMCHVARMVAMLLLQVGQWSVVLPSVPMTIWLAFLTAQLVMTRIPFLPSQDLMVLGLGVVLSTLVNVPAVAVAGMFVAAGALSQVANLVIFVSTSIAGYNVSREPIAEKPGGPPGAGP
jgi:hypothetical protein